MFGDKMERIIKSFEGGKAMCTAVTYKTKDHYFGRNLDLEYSYNETITIVPRNYEFKLNKKVKSLARKSALAYKVKNNAIVVVEDFNMETPKTKEFITIAKNLKVADRKLLLVLSEKNNFVYLSARNLEKASVVTASELNTYKILDAANLVLTESSVAAIEKLFNA